MTVADRITADYDPIMTGDDVVKAGICIVPGLRDWCAQHDFDFRTFIKRGYPASVLIKTNCAVAERVITLRGERDGRW